MLQSTLKLLRAGLETDPSLTPLQKSRILAAIRDPERLRNQINEVTPQLIRFKEAMRMLGVGRRTFHQMCHDRLIPKRKLAGNKRATHVLRSDVLTLIQSKGGQQ